jgi:hypothetical protein
MQAGKTVYHGEYNLRCKWLNTPAKLFTQAQSMEFDSAGRHYQLAPSGLLEITANANNENLSLREGYFIKIVFKDKPDTNGHFYAWNATKYRWDNFYDYDYTYDDSKLAAIDFYNFYAGKKTAKEIYSKDISDLNRRFENFGYSFLLDPGEIKAGIDQIGGYWVAAARDKPASAAAYTLKRGKSLIGLKKEFVDKKTEDGIVKFQIFDKTATLFPELKAFENYIFEVETKLNPRDFSAQFIRGNIYNDVRIVQIGTQFVMDLRTDEGYWRLDILSPAEKYKNNPAKAKICQNEFNNRFKKYLAVRNQKNTVLINYLNKNKLNDISIAKNTLLLQSLKTKGTTVKEMKIRSLGLFAWANPVQQPDTFSLIIKFTDDAGIPLDVKRAFVAHTSPFSYQSFNAADNYNVFINPAKLQYIACIDARNRVYVLTAAEFKSKGIKNNSLVFLAVNPLANSIKTLKDLEKYLGIK